MARISHEYRIESGEPDEKLSARLTDLSSDGWEPVGVTYGAPGLICVLRREKDFEVAKSLQAALEENEPALDVISHFEVPRDEL